MINEQSIDLLTHTAIKDGNKWIYKAKPVKPFTIKPKSSYRDKPQFSVIERVEDEMKKDGHQMIFDIGVGVIRFLSKL